MKQLTKNDKIWSWTLILFPAVLLIASLIPGIMQVYFETEGSFKAGSLIKTPGNTAVDNLSLPAITAMAYTVILAICYYRSQGLGTLKAIMIFSFFCSAITAFALIIKANDYNINLVKPWPYSAIPLLYLVLAILTLVRLKKEEAIYDGD